MTLPANFNRALVTEVQVVFDTAPGGGSLGLTQTNIGPETTSQGLRVQTQVRNVDRDSALEYVIRILQNPFASTSFFQFSSSRPVLAMIASKTINLKKERAINIALSAYDPDGDAITFSVDQAMLDTLTGASIEPITGVFTWTPPASAVRDAAWQVGQRRVVSRRNLGLRAGRQRAGLWIGGPRSPIMGAGEVMRNA